MSTIPSYDKFMLPILKLHQDGQVHHLPDSYDALAIDQNVSNDARHELLESGRQTRFENRIGWARTYLKKAGLIEIVSPGKTKITERGLQVLKKLPQAIDISFLNQFPEFREFRSGTKRKEEVAGIIENQSTPQDQIEEGYWQIRRQLAIELLEKIKSAPSSFFEQLVVDLMLKLGYGGSRKDAGEAVGRSGDHGIDGVIKEDKLGLDVIYLQAKRWQNTVGRPEVQAFVGSLEGFKAKKGVFITTSQFSTEALEYVLKIDKKIVLIDGDKLTNLMIDNGLGVSTVDSYEVKEIDTDYFEG